MNAVKVLGACGLVSGLCSTVGGFTGKTWLIGVGSAIMFAGNLFAMFSSEVSVAER